MKRAALFLVLIFCSSLVWSSSVHAVVPASAQDIGAGSTPVAAGTGQVDGVNFTADGEATLTDGQPLNSNGVNQDAAKTYEDGKGTLTFAGSSAVNGDVGVFGGFRLSAINIDGGGTVTFAKTPAGATAIRATNLVFGSAATSDGTVSIADNMDLTAAVTTFTTDTGTLTFVGTSTMTGQIGTSANLLKKVNIGAWPAMVTFNNDIYATEIYTANDGEVEFADGADYNRDAAAGVITTPSDGYGYLRLKGSSVINASIGTAANNWYEIRLDFADPSDVAEITGDVHMEGMNGVNFDHDGEVRIGGNFYGPVESDTGIADTGTITFGGNADIGWLCGAGALGLKRVNANGTGTLITSKYDFTVQTLNFGGDGTVDLGLSGGPTNIGTVTTSQNGTGTLVLNGVYNIVFPIGDEDLSLKEVAAGRDGWGTGINSEVYTDTYGLLGTSQLWFGSDSNPNLHANNLKFRGDGLLVLDDETILPGDIINASGSNNSGEVDFSGTATVMGNVGASGAALKTIEADGAEGALVDLQGDVYADSLILADDGEVQIGGTAILGGVTNDSGVDNSGTLTFGGNGTIEGGIGGAGTALKMITLAGSRSTVTSGGNVATKGIGLGANTMNITGTFDLSDNGTIATQVNGPESYGKITSSGAATVPATTSVNVSVAGYVSSGTKFTVVDGTGGTGVKGSIPVTSNSRILSFASASSDSEDLILTATRTTTYNSIATGNAGAVGAVLEQIGAAGATGDMLDVLNTLDNLSNTDEIAQALETVVPVVDGGVNSVSNNIISQFIGTAMARLEEMFASVRGAGTGDTGVSTGSKGLNGFEAWGQGFGEYVHQKPRGLSNGYRATIWGTAIGGDLPAFNDKVRLGLSGGYAQSNINSKDNSGRTDIDSYQGTIYGGYMDSANPYYLNGAFSFAYNKYESLRHIAIGAITRTADSDYDGQQYSVLVDGGYALKAGKFGITPVASLQYMRLHIEGYTETGADALNLSVRSQNYDMLQSGLGMKIERPFKTKSATIIPEVHARWLYDFIGDMQETTSTFSGGGGSFATQGFDPARHSLNVGAKLTLAANNNWSLETNYDFEYKEDFAAHTGWANARYRF